MTDFFKRMGNVGTTANGDLGLKGTLDDMVDFFSTGGLGRYSLLDRERLCNLFVKNFNNNPELALRSLVYLRDIKGGLGERDTFRAVASMLFSQEIKDKDLAKKALDTIFSNLSSFGRMDDLIYIADNASSPQFNEIISTFVAPVLYEDSTSDFPSLLAKWLPSENASSPETRRLGSRVRRALLMSPRDYRKTLSSVRSKLNLIETNLTQRNYSKVDFEKMPSKALFQYRNAFMNNMPKEYQEFLDKVDSGEAEIKTTGMNPFDVVRGVLVSSGSYFGRTTVKSNQTIESTWKALDGGSLDTSSGVLVVADSSASMCVPDMIPMTLSIATAIFTSERMSGVFKDKFISFSNTPKLMDMSNLSSLGSKVEYFFENSEIASTNIEATFQLILDTAVSGKVPQEELPEKILIVSDLQFDRQTNNSSTTVFRSFKQKFEDAGYTMPEVIYWNAAASNYEVKVGGEYNEQGVFCISGYSNSLLSQFLNGKFLNQEELMMQTLMNTKYDFCDILEDVDFQHVEEEI